MALSSGPPAAWAGDVGELRQVLAGMRGFFDGEEGVDELDHALQCATHALAAGAPPDVVAAALLHDVGRAPAVSGGYPGAPHEQAGARWLGGRASEKVAWLVSAHVAAKVFLVNSDPVYFNGLSAASVSSLVNQRDRETDLVPWTSHRWWPEAVQLRRWDDAAKVPGATTVSVDVVLREVGAL